MTDALAMMDNESANEQLDSESSAQEPIPTSMSDQSQSEEFFVVSKESCVDGLQTTQALAINSESSAVPDNLPTSTSLTSKLSGYVTGRSSYEIEVRKLQNDNQKLQTKVEDLKIRLEDLKTQRDAFEGSARRLQRDKTYLIEERDRFTNERHASIAKFQNGQRRIQKLQEEITYYKANISAATRPPDRTADDVIRDKFDNLFRDLQSFVVGSFREAYFEYDRVPEVWKVWMNDYIPYAYQLEGSDWYNITISVIAQILTDKFDPKYYFGLADEPLIVAAADLTAILKPDEKTGTETWLEATRELIATDNADALVRAEGKLLEQMILEVERAITRPMNVNWSENLREGLARIFVTGLELFRLLHRQPAMFFLTMAPAFEDDEVQYFVSETMEDAKKFEDEDVLSERPIEISLFPMVHKERVGGVEQTWSSSIVSRAKVVLEAPTRKDENKRQRRKEEFTSSSDPSKLSPHFFQGQAF